MKTTEEKQLQAFLRRNDPASVRGARAEKMMAAIWQRLDEPAGPTVRGFLLMPGRASLSLSRGIALATFFVMLGVFAGNGLNAPASSSAEKISVYAMAEPWENIIVEE